MLLELHNAKLTKNCMAAGAAATQLQPRVEAHLHPPWPISFHQFVCQSGKACAWECPAGQHQVLCSLDNVPVYEKNLFSMICTKDCNCFCTWSFFFFFFLFFYFFWLMKSYSRTKLKKMCIAPAKAIGKRDRLWKKFLLLRSTEQWRSKKQNGQFYFTLLTSAS